MGRKESGIITMPDEFAWMEFRKWSNSRREHCPKCGRTIQKGRGNPKGLFYQPKYKAKSSLRKLTYVETLCLGSCGRDVVQKEG